MADFHFIRPMWFIALFALPLIIWLIKKLKQQYSGWQNVIPQHLQQVLISQGKQKQTVSTVLPVLIFLLSVLALAGPTYQKLPQPVYSVERGSVIVMDMSFSMYSTDLSPNRLTRARFKVIDILDSVNEGDIGLVAYAGDNFVISPLTQDINNIKLLLPSLTPEIMPEVGSDPFPALLTANDMLVNAGHLKGDIYWVTDDADRFDVDAVQEFIKDYPHRLNILGVGSLDGAPIKLPNGQLLKDEYGQIVIPKLPVGRLKGLAAKSGGVYQTITHNHTDIDKLTAFQLPRESTEQSENQHKLGDSWQELGPYIVLLILPLVLSYFRRGIILSIAPLFFLFPSKQSLAQEQIQQPVTASSTTQSTVNKLWKNLWQTQDQQAQQHYQQENYQTAAQQFENESWQASAHYKAGNYEEAVAGFQQFDTPQAHYNRGNALAKLGQLDEASKAYEKALTQQPDFEQALENKKLVDELIEQQKQQEQQEQQNQEQNNDQQQDQQSDSEQENPEQNKQQGDQDNANDESQSQESDSNKNNESKEQQNDKQSENQQPDSQQTEQEQNQQKEEQQSQQQQKNKPKNEQQAEQKQAQAAQLTEQQKKELEQKHLQLLNKVTDDPHLLLRNKMQLEYQKRRHQNSGAKKKW